MKQRNLQKVFKFWGNYCKLMVMKRILLTLILFLVFCFGTFGQDTLVCPRLKVEGPEKITEGDLATFTAFLENNQDIKNIPLKWKATKNGSEIEVSDEYRVAERSKAIVVDTEGVNSFSVSVEMSKGVPTECKAKIELSITIDSPKIYPKISDCNYDEYDETTFEREKARLDNYAVELHNKSDTLGFFQFFVTKDKKLSQVQNRITKIINHFEKRGIIKGRIKFSVFDSKYENTRFWLVPSGVDLPNCNNCKPINIGKI